MPVPFLTGIDANNQRILGVASPSSGTDAANKDYVDSSLAGLRWKQPVRVATTGNAALATAYENGDTVDGVTLATGDRILIKDQTSQTENGIYVVAASGAPTRASDADSSAELTSATVFVTSGTVNADRAYTQTTDAPTLGSSNIVFVQFGGGAAYTADGQGIELSGTQFALELDGTSLSKSGSGLRIGSAAAANGLTESGGLLSVGAGTGITVNTNDVAINTSVVVRKFAVDCTAANPFVVSHNLGTTDVQVEVIETAGNKQTVYADVTRTDTNTVSIAFANTPSSGQYRAIVQG